MEYDLANEIFEHYQLLSTAFYKRNQTGDLMSRLTEDVGRVRMYLGPVVLYGTNLVSMIIIIIIAMLNVNVRLTLYVLAPLPLLSLFIYIINGKANQKNHALQVQFSQLTSIAQETFAGIRVVKSFFQEQATVNYFSQEAEIYKQKALEVSKIQVLSGPLMMLLIGCSTLITIYFGGKQTIAGQISTGNIVEFIVYINMLIWPVSSIGWVTAMIQRAAASQKRINEFIKIKPEITNAPNAKTVNLKGNIEFKNVSFTYPDTNIEALKNISFNVKPLEKIAIIGKTGSGKTTIAELLCRKYDTSSGVIEIDGNNVKNLNITSLRTQMGYVPQDVFLFSNTITQNIAMGVINEQHPINFEKIQQAAQQAAVLNDILSLPQQFETVIGERGVTLSGGQKQRISIARALIKNPPILIFDDCLSAVDVQTEHLLLKQLSEYLNNKTAIIITHRVFSLIEFNKIIVLHEGNLVEQGTFNELMQLKGYYYDMYLQQQHEP